MLQDIERGNFQLFIFYANTLTAGARTFLAAFLLMLDRWPANFFTGSLIGRSSTPGPL